MSLTAKPSKNVDLSKIDDIQNEFFGDEENSIADIKKAVSAKTEEVSQIEATQPATASNDRKVRKGKTARSTAEKPNNFKDNSNKSGALESANPKIADLLAEAKFEGVRHTSRPFTIPRSLTIDLNRLKSKFRTRDLHYTQNELMDKMLKESLEIVTAENYSSLRKKAFDFVKSPELYSRRSVTLSEETVSGMAELKADLALAHGRRFSADEIFTTLLAVAFSSLYENGLL